MNKSKVKEFVKENKKGFTIGTKIIISAVACMIVGKSLYLSDNKSDLKKENEIRDIDIPDGFSIGNVTDLFEDGDEIVTIVRELTVNDLGKLGKELIKYGLVADGAEAAITAEFLKEV